MTDNSSDVDKLLASCNNPTSGQVIVLKEELIKQYSAELVDFLMDKAMERKDFGMASKVLSQLVEVKKAYWPATQKNVNVGVDIFDVQLDKWFKAQQIISQNKPEEIINDA